MLSSTILSIVYDSVIPFVIVELLYINLCIWEMVRLTLGELISKSDTVIA
jgi:hypothetical protein